MLTALVLCGQNVKVWTYAPETGGDFIQAVVIEIAGGEGVPVAGAMPGAPVENRGRCVL